LFLFFVILKKYSRKRKYLFFIHAQPTPAWRMEETPDGEHEHKAIEAGLPEKFDYKTI
jgi:hypothetical protein